MKKLLFSLVVQGLGVGFSFSQEKLGEVACIYNTSTNLDSTTAIYQ